MHCYSCGIELPKGAAFCPACGVITLSNASGSGFSPYDPTIAPPPPGWDEALRRGLLNTPYDPTIAPPPPATPPRESPLPPTQYASPPYGMPLQRPYEQLPFNPTTPPPPPLLKLHTRNIGRTILSLFFYLWGVFWFIIGLLGGIIHSASNTVIWGLCFVTCLVVGLVFLVVLLRYRKHFHLSARRLIFLEIGLTLIGFLALFFFDVGIVLALYGLSTTFVAYW